MSGIILFVDDKVFEKESDENELYLELRAKAKYPVFPLQNLLEFETAISSISSIKAVILDWEFKKDVDPDDVGTEIPTDDPESILKKKIYSLIYVFSNKGPGTETREQLESLYKDKIKFNYKNDITNTEKCTANIIQGIENMEKTNLGLKVPFFWSQQINKSVQEIFWELEEVDNTWIINFYTEAIRDGADPSVEVISVINQTLSGKLLIDAGLKQEIERFCNPVVSEDESTVKDFGESQKGPVNYEKYIKLFKYLYFRNVKEEEPVSIGDVFEIPEFGKLVVISPECDFGDICENREETFIDCLVFSQIEYDKLGHFKKNCPIKHTEIFTKIILGIEKSQVNPGLNSKLVQNIKNSKETINKEVKDLIDEKWNTLLNKEKVEGLTQKESRYYILPFDFNSGSILNLDFQAGFRSIKTSSFIDENKKVNNGIRLYRIQMPYINDIRQRFFSYKGRIGVPGISKDLRNYLLNNKIEKKSK
jgi:hypothetical protein